MAFIEWGQSFRTPLGVLLENAGVSVYLSGTSTSARIFDTNDVLHDTAPQIYTDSVGKVTLKLDDEDYSSAQLFDVFCAPDGACSDDDRVSLKSLMLFQDTEGNRNFKNIFAQTTIPTEGMKEGDLWFDTDNDNEPYRYDGTNWISIRDGTIATAANTANWSEVIDDDTHKPDDDSDVTGDNTALNTTYVNGSETQTGQVYEVYGTLRIRSGNDIEFYSASTFRGGISSSILYGMTISSQSTIRIYPNTGYHLDVWSNIHPHLNDVYYLGSSTLPWKGIFLSSSGINITGSTITEDGSNNLTFKDAVTGSKTLAQLAGGGGGNVVGPASSNDNAICLFNGASGELIKESLTHIDSAGALYLPNNTAIRWKDTGGSWQNVIAYDSVDNIIIGVDGDDATVYIERLNTSTAGVPLRSSRRFSIVSNYWKAAAEHQRMSTIYHEMQSDAPKSTMHFDMGEDGSEVEMFALENDNGTKLAIVKGSLKVEGGSPGTDKLFRSDANGLATWISLDISKDTSPTLGGDLTGNHHIGFINNKGIWAKDVGGTDRAGLLLNTNDDWEVGTAADNVILGYGSSESNPVMIRINGANSQRLIKSSQTDVDGKYFVVLE